MVWQRNFWLALGVIYCGLWGGSTAQPARAAEGISGEKIKFKRTMLDEKFRSEGVAVGDFNKDGKLDIAAGSVWYAAPDWKMHQVREKAEEHNPHGYSDSFVNAADDLNGDGWVDLLVVDFPGKPTWWFENPQNQSGPWKRHECTPVTNNESPQYLDLDGDGQREWIMATCDDANNPDGEKRYQAIIKRVADPLAKWTIQRLSEYQAPMTTKYSHGIGAGDVNGDGRQDLFVKDGWWEAPAVESSELWKFHPASFGQDCAHMYAYDVDGDGDSDIINSSAHQIGVWWHEQTPEGWKTHTISKDFSQSHSLNLVDMNGDGLKDIVTGKRWWAHGPNGDANPNDPAVVVWFELSRENGQAHWKMHHIDHNSGVGTQFEVADINGDKLPDVIVSNKKGVYLLEQIAQ
ncbi:MAG: VCBS repeat-containing protein [Pirellulales bacterium]|nr:VCBS repeat-containing protein [Pirellulales bacterium]